MKSLLTLFGASLDAKANQQLTEDGLQYKEEGIWVTVEYHNFSSRFKKPSAAKISGLGAFGLSTNKLVGSMRNKRIVGVDFWTMDDRDVHVEMEKGRCVKVSVASKDKSKGWTGKVEYRFFLKHMDKFYATFSTLEGIYKF